MNDLLSDLLNNRIQAVPTRGTVNGVMEYGVPDDNDEFSDSAEESDTEQKEYVEKEWKSYVRKDEEMDALSDVEDGPAESILGSEILELLHVPKVFSMYKFDTYYKKELPIDSFKDIIIDVIDTNPVAIIHGPTGCGKTTQVPQYILDHCRETNAPCNIVVTQPRRIAAINIAQRVCEERGWAIGTVCGYQVGLDKNVGEDVVLTYMTTEVLLQKLILQKNLNRHTHIIIDEVHERTKSLDFLLLIVRKYLYTNSPSVKVILMSATMEEKDFAYYFRSIPRGNPDQYLLAPVLQVDKQSEYETSIYYNEQFAKMDITYNIDEPCVIRQQYEMCLRLITIFDAIEKGENKGVGSVLVFLPGFHEIEEMNKVLISEKSSDLHYEIIPLHSSLTNDQMIKAFQKPKEGSRKIILSTNIAESSLTVADVKYVIDFCLTKIMTINETTKFSSLSLQWASHNNCKQRAGRVGRVASGRVYRLVPYEFYMTQMLENAVPELQRAPLENIILYMKLLDLNDTPKNVLSLAISPPNLKDVESCIWHLKEVGALLRTCRGNETPADGDITFMGRIMGSLPIDILLSKLILFGHMFDCLDDAIIIAAGCMARNLFMQNFKDRFKCYRTKLLMADRSCSDFVILLNLYGVWLGMKRQHAFRTVSEEYAWCKTQYVNLKGLREWDLLIREIKKRLSRLGIEATSGAERRRDQQLTAIEKSTVLKIIICGAFYPNYFIRSSDFGQVDSREALKLLNGRDPCNTVYFMNMKINQPGRIYVRQIKELLQAENSTQIGFDEQSSKVFVEFKNIRQPEPVTVQDKHFVITMPGAISLDVYESVRKRQLNVPFKLQILPDQKAWEFANKTEEKQKMVKLEEDEDINCFTAVEYSPLPSRDIEYVTVIVTHIVDAGLFYCQNWNDETRDLLDRIYTALNRPGVVLEPVGEKIEINKKMYAATFNQDSKLYRCKVLKITPGVPNSAQVLFVDYGNTQKVLVPFLHELPPHCPEVKVDPIAMCCVLSGIQPNLARNTQGIWCPDVNDLFKRKTQGVLLNAKVYSVVDDIVHLELFKQNTPNVSFNKWLIDEEWGKRCEESQRSKMDHDIRQKVLRSENPITMNSLFKEVTTSRNYTDFEAPSKSEATDVVELKGPFSPLEMRVCGLVQASLGASARVEGDSVNAVMLDDNAEDPHARLIVAGVVSQSSGGRAIKLSQTTIMPSIPGLPMLMTLLFCPQMEPKLTPDGSRVASILCGLGYKEFSDKPNFPMHDISLVLDTELHDEIITQINKVRYFMNATIKMLSNIYEELEQPERLLELRKKLTSELLNLLHMRQKSVDPVNVRYADVWQKSVCEDVEILRMETQSEDDDIWPMLWFVKLKEDARQSNTVKKNLEEMSLIAKRLAPEKEIVCELCNSVPLRNISEVRIHLFREEHKRNLNKHN